MIKDYLQQNVKINFNWSLPVDKAAEQSWFDDAHAAFDDLTVEDINTYLKWCNHAGDKDQIIAAITALITPEDLPISCTLSIEFTKMEE